MKSYQLVEKTIRGENPGQTPLYGWVSANLSEQISREFGSVENFEDHYRFDMAHLFGGPGCFDQEAIRKVREEGEVTPEALLSIPLLPVDNMADYENIKAGLEHHRVQRERFCYVQTNGIFEALNDPFGIEDHLCWMALYPEELKEVYARQAQWNRKFAEHCIELGVDMVHVSDDWGAQKSLMFSKEMWWDMIYPNHKVTADFVKSTGTFLSLHSDGHIAPVLDGVVKLGYDVVHPWQETAGMDYQMYLDQYQDKLAILGGICVQSTLGFGDLPRLEREIRRVFGLLKGKRWMCCTTHFVQDHCSMEELVFAFDLAARLARE